MGWIDRIIDMLRTTDWGLIFAQDEIGAIARKLILRRVEKNDYIFREGDTENYLVFIIHGSVVIRKNEKPEKDVIILPNGTHFGELSLIDNLPRSASAQALEDCILLILSKENYEMLLQEQPALGVKVVTSIAQLISRRLRDTTERLVDNMITTRSLESMAE